MMLKCSVNLSIYNHPHAESYTTMFQVDLLNCVVVMSKSPSRHVQNPLGLLLIRPNKS